MRGKKAGDKHNAKGRSYQHRSHRTQAEEERRRESERERESAKEKERKGSNVRLDCKN